MGGRGPWGRLFYSVRMGSSGALLICLVGPLDSPLKPRQRTDTPRGPALPTSPPAVPAGVGDAAAAAAVASLAAHPSLARVLLPMQERQRGQSHHPLPVNLIIALARAAPHIALRAVPYGGINNEWLEWLEGEGEEGPPAAAAAGGSGWGVEEKEGAVGSSS